MEDAKVYLIFYFKLPNSSYLLNNYTITLEETLFCQNKTYICENDGICVNKSEITSYQDIRVGFFCKCPRGYSGFLCDISKTTLSYKLNFILK